MSVPTPVLYRRSPNLVCYWAGRRLVFENYATRTRVAADPTTCRLLTFFDTWRPADAVLRRFKEYRPSSVRKALMALVRCSLVQRSDRRQDRRERAMDAWASWNPAAGFFHFSTKDLAYASDLAAVERRLRRQAKRSPMPASAKAYPRARQVDLPPARTDGQLAEVLLARRTWRAFSSRAVDLSALGTLLGLTWGVQRWIDLPGLGRVALKSAPSGGARHPIEAYVLALRVRDLPRGLYHYAADAHRLELLKRGASGRQLVSYLPTQSWFESAAALVLMTAVFPRAQWRYPSPRAYRAALIEAGHVCQTFCLVATWLGLAPFCSMALADSQIERDLGVDGVTESVLYAAGAGTRPEGIDWAPWPTRRPAS